MTPEGYEKLKQEIEHIKSVERPANIKAIEEARGHGDLSENADYDAAKNEQGLINARLQQAESLVSRAEIIDPKTLSGDSVMFGATVTLVDLKTDEKMVYKIVGTMEADIKQNTISFNSPIAKSLIGKQVGEEVLVKTPSGAREFGIEKIEYK